jgi:hypothetical protein
MISIKKLFENFVLPGKIHKMKQIFHSQPMLPAENRRGLNKIKKLNSKLKNINTQIQR